MPSLLTGSRQTRLSGSFNEYNMAIGVPMPTGFHGGKILLPQAGNEFQTWIEGNLVIGTAQTIAAAVSGCVPLLMGIRAYASGGTGHVRIRRTDLTIILSFGADGSQPLNLTFNPIALVTNNVEHGLEVVQLAGTASSIFLSAWGYYALIP